MTLDAHAGVDLDGFTLDAALTIEAGTTTAVVGPNGAGKTTLLRALAGLCRLSRGRIDIGGTVVDEPAAGIYVQPERRSVGVVFQDGLLFDHLSALENVAFGLRSRGCPRVEARARALDWLERVGLESRPDSRPSELSGGQAQRVALARALITQPKLLLLDEPLSALDTVTRRDMRRELRRHLCEYAEAALLITHDAVDVAMLADEIVVIDNGRVIQKATPAEITARPRSGWIAELIGTNLFAGEANGTTLICDGGGALSVAELAPPGRVYAVIHPRTVVLSRTRPEGSARNSWPGRITTVEPLGDRFRVRIEAAPPIVAEVTAAAVASIGLDSGSDVWVAVKATEIEVYPQ